MVKYYCSVVFLIKNNYNVFQRVHVSSNSLIRYILDKFPKFGEVNGSSLFSKFPNICIS